MVNLRKVAIIGCGFVGSSIAFSLMQKQLFSEMVLIDANTKKAEGEAMDLGHGLPYTSPMNIYAGTYDDIVDCAMIIITAGANQKPDETRLDLIDKNVRIFKSIIPEISKILIAQHPDELGNGGLGNIAQTGQFLNGKGRQACHMLEHHQRNVIICGVRVTVIQGDQEPVIENPHGVTLLCCTYYSKVGRSAASKNSSSPWRPAQIMGVQMFWAVTLARPGQRQRTMPVVLLPGIHAENLRDWMRSLLVPLFCFIFCLPGKADFDHKGNSGRSPVGRSCRVRS